MLRGTQRAICAGLNWANQTTARQHEEVPVHDVNEWLAVTEMLLLTAL
jgi:hypothetical protein